MNTNEAPDEKKKKRKKGVMISTTFPDQLLDDVDIAALKMGLSRGAFIRLACIKMLEANLKDK